MAIEKLSVILELVTGNYNREAKQAADATGRIGGAAKTVTGSLGMMIGPAAIGGAIAGLGRMALAAGENADRLFDLAAQTGLSTDELQRWEFVAKAAGAETEVFSDAVKAIIKNLSEAANGTGAAAKAYETLGISVLDANGNLREGGEITAEVFDKLAGMENITERNALAQDIFGKKWEETISILDLGTEALSNLREEGKKGVVSAEALRNADKFRETWQKFMAQVGPKLNEALGKLSPALTAVAEAAIDAFDAMEPLIDFLGFVADKFGDMNVAVDEGRESSSRWAQSWAIASDIGQGAIFGMVGVLGALFDEENALTDANDTMTGSWQRATVEVDATSEALGRLLDAAAGAKNLVGKDLAGGVERLAVAVDMLRLAEKALSDARLANLNPALAALRAIQDSVEAQDALTVAQDEGKVTQFELTQLQLEAAIAAEEAKIAIIEFAVTGSEGMADFAEATGLGIDAARMLAFELGALTAKEWRVQIFADYQTNAASLAAAGAAAGNTDFLKDLNSKAVGGPISAGRPYLVGEMGPELIIPGASGTVIPNSQLGGLSRSVSIVVQSPMNDFRSDLQYATIVASLTNLVEGF